MFESAIGNNEIIIDDNTDINSVIDLSNGRGLNLGLRGPKDYEYGTVANPFPQELLIPRNEWQGRIESMEADKSRLSDLIRWKNLPPKNQEQTNYCWVNAPTHCLEIIRLQQNQQVVILSPASAGAQIKGYRNVGGWGLEALQWISDHGLVPVSQWPANAISRSYATENNMALAKSYAVDEWIELKPRDLDQLISCLLRRIPVAVGYNWWGHEVTAIDAVWRNGTVAIRIRNSWGNWGDFGFGILEGSKMYPDDACAPLTAIAS